MKTILLICETAALLALSGCSAARVPASAPSPHQAAAPVEQDQGWAVLVEADREVRALEIDREATSDPFVASAITHQIETIEAHSDALIDAMSIGDGQSHDARIRRLSSVVQRDMGVGAAAEMQATDRSPR